ncbi:hypothetical protein ACRQ5Q_14590 [Bradyrhizobium sp. PMVTL-01]|uniref:hypothetical protein n=1 Tax=Bradyrhizobium sp. PMVTL-01 TaxID=3434999 RepID=UPI003F6EB900
MNFFVWRKGLRGPTAALQDLDPRSSLDWKLNEENTIAIVKLPEERRSITLDEAIATYPCPKVA